MEENNKSENIESNNNLIEGDPTKIHIEKNPSTVFQNWIKFLKVTLSIRKGTVKFSDVIKETKESTIFKGYNVWILVCSIVIASVGLNVDSTAVIVGAMLISPLMGPIRGVGFGVGTNDLGLIKLSLKNMGITVGVSLFTSWIYFLITPIDQLTTQLFLRTEPNFLDVIIAFTGGLAGVIAVVKGKNDTVIPGVAIATALMPPLCTAGYGLANGQWNFFFGASYLFLINSVLIALSTVLIVRYLQFPKKHYLDEVIEKKVKNSIIIFTIVVLAPSAYLFYTMIQRTVFENNAQEFVDHVIKYGTDGKVSTFLGYGKDSSYIDIEISGDYVSKDVIKSWNNQRVDYDLSSTFLNIYQGKDYSGLAEKLDLLQQNNINDREFFKTLKEKDKQILELSQKYETLEKESSSKDLIDFNYLLNSFKIDYPEFKSVKINRSFGINRKGENDTTYVMFVKFNPKYENIDQSALKSKISNRLKFELKQKMSFKQDSIPVIVF